MFSHCRVAAESVQKNSTSGDGECSSVAVYFYSMLVLIGLSKIEILISVLVNIQVMIFMS